MSGMSPEEPILSSVASVGRRVRTFFSPLRSRVTETSVSGFTAMSVSAFVQSLILLPLISSMTSPAWKPAFSAGDAFSTYPTFAGPSA